MKKPYVIAVAGISGSGKTTFSNVLAEVLGIKPFIFDDLFFRFAHHNPVAAEEIVGIPFDKLDLFNYTKQIFRNIDVATRFANAAWEHTKQILYKELPRWEEDAKAVIFDFAGMDREFYERADLKIFVQACDSSLRVEKMIERETQMGRFSQEEALLLNEMSIERNKDLLGLQDILIVNNYQGLDHFKQESNRIAKILSGKGII